VLVLVLILVLIAFGLLVVALLSSEAGLATTAYLFAYAVWFDKGPWPRRLVTLAPYAVIVVWWRGAWSYLGYGVSDGMGLYVDPLREPMAYAVGLKERLPPLLLGQLALPPSDVCMMFESGGSKVYALVAGALVALIALTVLPVLGRSRQIAFWITGMLLSLPPIAATVPSDRLLYFVGLGAMPLAGEFLVRVLGRRGIGLPLPPVRRRVCTIAGFGLLIIHGAFAPLGLMLRAAYPAGPPSLRRELELTGPLDASVEGKDLVIVNAPAPFFLVHFPLVQALDGAPVPRVTRVLSAAFPSVQIHRLDAQTLVIRPELGFLHWTWDRLFRSDRYPMGLRERVELTGMSVEVTSINDDGRPTEATFQFANPLDDGSIKWLHWTDGSFEPWTPPRIGQTVELRPRRPRLW